MFDVGVIHADAPTRERLTAIVGEMGYRARSAATPSSLSAAPCRVIVAGMPANPDAVRDSLHELSVTWPAARLIAVGPSADIALATDAVRSGAYDYLPEPVEPHRLESVLRTLLSTVEPPAATQAGEDGIFVDPVTCALLAKADRAAAVDSTVLITGETGTGKEVLARRIQRTSPNRRKFVPVNCGSLPASLIEAELFGHRRGAFTGAVADAKGLIEEADGGVLFLDEIGEMPLSLQVSLLRFLDTGEIRAVGGTRVRHVNVRVLAATNRCLEDEVHERRFREDLFFRLSVVRLHAPPLRERRGDILPLLHYHLRRGAAKVGLPPPAIADDAVAALMRYRWPGNIRELQNTLEHAIVQQTGGVITIDDLPPALACSESVASSPRPNAAEELAAALQAHDGNQRRTAAALGISRTTLWRRLRQLNMARAGLESRLDDESA